MKDRSTTLGRHLLVPCWLGLAFLACRTVPAEAGPIFIGDATALGAALPAGTGSRADTISPLSYIYSDEVASVGFTAGSAMQISLMSVNLLAQDAGSLTPFVALYNGGPAGNAGSYTLISKGDVLTIPAGTPSGVLFNGQFTVGGVNPVLNLNAGDTIVAGLFQSTRIVVFGTTSQSAANDRIWTTNITSGVNPGQALVGGNDGFNFNLTYFYDIGFQQAAAAPEPASLGLVAIGAAGLFGCVRKRRRP